MQTAKTPSLCWVHSHFVGFVMLQLISLYTRHPTGYWHYMYMNISNYKCLVWNMAITLFSSWATTWQNVSLGVSDRAKLKPACTATEASYSNEISAIESRDIILSKQRTTKALIRLRRCAGWSAPLLFAYDIRHIFSWPGSFVLNWFSTKSFRFLILVFVFIETNRLWKSDRQIISICSETHTVPNINNYIKLYIEQGNDAIVEYTIFICPL